MIKRSFKLYGRGLLLITILASVAFVAQQGIASADTLSSSNFTLSPAVGDSFGGSFSSGSYSLIDSGGEAAIGSGSGGSYTLGAGFVAELEHAINLFVEPDGLVNYWPMSEGAGPTIHDASGNSDNGTTTGTPAWVNGQIGQALQFDGASQYLTVSGAHLPTDHITVAAWVNVASTTSHYNVVSNNWQASSGSWDLFVDSGHPGFGVYDTSAHNATCSESLNAGKWHFLVATYDGTSAKTYLDGNLCATSNAGAISLLNGTSFKIGDNASGADHTIDDVKIFNRVLSSDEMIANYNAGMDGLDSGVVIPPVLSGNSQIVNADVIIRADTPYSLLTSLLNPLTDEADSNIQIPSIGSTISAPDPWTEGSTIGLGFTVLNGPTGVDSKWGNSSNQKYAAVPGTDQSFYSRPGTSGGVADVVEIQYRLDVSETQPSGRYKGNIIYTATATP